KEFGEQQKMQIEFHHDLRELPQPEVSLCLYRVLQEAVRNAAKHSGAQFFEIELKGQRDEVQLTVSDTGVGFDTSEAMEGRGLGLVSMRERLKLVKGELSIQSKRGQGTTIYARVPLDLSATLPREQRDSIRPSA